LLGRRLFGIPHRVLAIEIWSAGQLPSQESDWSSVEWVLSLSGLWNVLEAMPSVLHLPRRKYTLFEPDPSSPYLLQLDREFANFLR
jgi:hypothetical protein